MIAQRALAVVAAVFLTGAIAIGMLADPGWPLGAALYAVDAGVLEFVQTTLRVHLPQWAWGYGVLPFLVRPAWLLPAFVGMVAGGLCLTLTWRSQQASRSRRRRS